MAKKDELALKQSGFLSQDRPDYMSTDSSRGSEQVDREDLTIPRVEICQSLSKVRKKSDPAFIDGIEEGDIYNNLTRQNYGVTCVVVPVAFAKEFLLWRDQELGGGFGGAYLTEDEAFEAHDQQEKPEEWEVVLTHQHYVLILLEDGNTEEAVISMAKSKLKVSRNWNSQIRLVGGDRWCRAFNVTGVADQNANGQDFFNMAVTPVGFVDEGTFKKAEALYEQVVSGEAVADRSDGGTGEAAPNSDEF